MQLDRKALVPTQGSDHSQKTHSRLSRRTAGLLVIVAGLLVVYHYAHPGGFGSRGIPVIAPALHIALRGEVTKMSNSTLVVRIEDRKGGLTRLSRTIALNSETRYQSPGQPLQSGHRGLQYIQPGYRVSVAGLTAGDGQTVNASQIAVSFPPVTGTVRTLIGSNLVLVVPGQPHTMTIAANSRTAFFVPGGRWSRLSPGASVRVWIAPQPDDPARFNALTVMVRTPS